MEGAWGVRGTWGGRGAIRRRKGCGDYGVGMLGGEWTAVSTARCGGRRSIGRRYGRYPCNWTHFFRGSMLIWGLCKTSKA